MPSNDLPSPTAEPDGMSRARFRFTIVRVILQWIGVLAILFALIAWVGLPQWTRQITLLLSISITVALLRVEAAIHLHEADARLKKLEREFAAESEK